MITDSTASEASRRMFVKPLIIAQLYYPSSKIFVESTYCKIHDHDWFQPRLDLHDSNAKPASVDWPIERNRITDRCVCVCVCVSTVEDLRKSYSVTWGKMLAIFFSAKAFLRSTRTSSCWLRSETADRSTHTVVTAIHSDAAHIERRRLSPREKSGVVLKFSR